MVNGQERALKNKSYGKILPSEAKYFWSRCVKNIFCQQYHDMERPYDSRSIVECSAERLQIVIPRKRDWLVLVVLSIGLLFWSVIISILLWNFLEILANSRSGSLLVLIPIMMLIVIGILIFRNFALRWKSAEIITVQNGKLILERRSRLKDPREIYELTEMNDIRVYDDADDFSWIEARSRTFRQNTMIRFEYGSETVRFATEISYAEAEYLLALINTRIP